MLGTIRQIQAGVIAALVLAPAAGAAATTPAATTTAVATAPATTTAPATALPVTTPPTTTPPTTTAPTTATPTTTTAAVPCAGAGLLAVVRPGAAPEPVGPAVSAAERTGVDVASATDPEGTLAASDVRAGTTGCVGAAGNPGGTALSSAAWSVLGGAVSGTSLEADLVPSQAADGSGWTLRTQVAGLQVGGRPATVDVGDSQPVGGFGVLTAQARLDSAGPLRHWASALQLRLTAAHSGLPAGTTLLIGYAAADRVAAPPPQPAPPPTTTRPAPTTAPTTTAPHLPAFVAASHAPTAVHAHRRAEPETRKPATKATEQKAPAKKTPKRKRGKKKHAKRAGHRSSRPLRSTPPLDGGKYEFPVYGDVDWSDTYGGARSDVSGGWHHGEDLFADLGRPVVAVADGTVFAVGWNRIGGWRLWLRDDAGNEFYYAHLAGYTRLAHNNAHVRRGQVLGFVGNTGDAFTTPDHLHFEIHPVGFLYLGYDGAVDPTTYLSRWPHAGHVKRLPPAALPDTVAHGDGSLVDYRQLLALHDPHQPRKPADAGREADAGAGVQLVPRLPRTEAADAPVRPQGGGTPVLPAALGGAGGAAALAAAGVWAFRRRRTSASTEEPA